MAVPFAVVGKSPLSEVGERHETTLDADGWLSFGEGSCAVLESLELLFREYFRVSLENHAPSAQADAEPQQRLVIGRDERNVAQMRRDAKHRLERRDGGD